jgi:two-component system, NarL family, response regulator DegU
MQRAKQMNAKLTRVFIAEDSPSTRATLKAVLQRASDMEIVGEADEGSTIVDKVTASCPDVVLMDIGLPVMNGLEATKKLKEKFPELRVIMVTSNESDGVIFDAFSSGADGYYLKSGKPDSLLQAVRSVVSGAAWLHPAIAGRVLRSCVRGAARLMDRKRSGEQKVSRHEPVCVLVKVAGEMEASRRLNEAECIYEGAIALCERLGNEHDPEVPNLLTLYADMLYSQEKFVKAESLYLKALELRHQSLGYEHSDVAASLENLANLYDTRSNYAEAEHYYYWSLKIREKLSGPNDPLAHDTCAKLAWVYRAQGKTDLANEMELRAGKKK